MVHNAGINLPIACTLNEAELHDGYAYIFAATSDALMQIEQLVDMQRQCCSFLTFKIVVEAGRALMRVEVTGPKNANAVIADYFNFDSAEAASDYGMRVVFALTSFSKKVQR
jgi:hypothetical protein